MLWFTTQRKCSIMSQVIPISRRALSANVDRLGDLNAQIARLQDAAADIKAKLIDSGEHDVYGRFYRAVVADRETVRLDAKIVRSLLTPAQIASAQRVAHSTIVTLYDL